VVRPPPFGVVHGGGGPGPPPPFGVIRGAMGGVWLGIFTRSTEESGREFVEVGLRPKKRSSNILPAPLQNF
jgi:hypothetical protein